MSRSQVVDAGFAFLLGVMLSVAGFNPPNIEFALVLVVVLAWCMATYVQGRRP